MTISEEHRQILGLLRKARQKDCVGQAYLLIGDDGEYLNVFAKEWMKIAACAEPGLDGDACGHCPICAAIDGDRYEECFRVAPLSKTRIISIDAIREFDRMLGLSVRRDHLKVGVISEAECLGEAAQNSFLKTLEEPPGNTMLLLLTTNPRKLLPTIRSRCQIVSLLKNRKDYSMPAENGLFDVLAGVHRNAGISAALKALSSIKDILAGLADDAKTFVEENWDESWETVEDGDTALKKQLADLKQKKIETEYCRLREMYLDAIQVWYLQRYLIAAGISRELLPQPELLEYMKDQDAMDVLDAEEDMAWCDEMLRALKANVNEAIAIEAFLLQVCEKVRR